MALALLLWSRRAGALLATRAPVRRALTTTSKDRVADAVRRALTSPRDQVAVTASDADVDFLLSDYGALIHCVLYNGKARRRRTKTPLRRAPVPF